MKQYEKKANQTPVIAVQINLDTDGILYRKWGDNQHGKPGDWLVARDGEAYTIDQTVFAKTYKNVGPGQYIKTARVYAERVEEGGMIQTKEGRTQYEAGDFLVYNEEGRLDGYAMGAEKFESMYQPVAAST